VPSERGREEKRKDDIPVGFKGAAVICELRKSADYTAAAPHHERLFNTIRQRRKDSDLML